MTTIEVLDDIAFKEGYKDFISFIAYSNTHYLTEKIEEAMKLYAQQFIDAANQIIDPATEILPDTYDEDYEKWYDTVLINKDEDNS